MPAAKRRTKLSQVSSMLLLTPRGHQHNPLPRTQRIMKWFMNVFHSMLRGDIAQRRAGLDEMPEMIDVKILVPQQVLIQNQQRFIFVGRRGFPEEKNVGIAAGQNAGG